jgi:hypothetical protein
LRFYETEINIAACRVWAHNTYTRPYQTCSKKVVAQHWMWGGLGLYTLTSTPSFMDHRVIVAFYNTAVLHTSIDNLPQTCESRKTWQCRSEGTLPEGVVVTVWRRGGKHTLFAVFV